jgi:hypothetical protein
MAPKERCVECGVQLFSWDSPECFFGHLQPTKAERNFDRSIRDLFDRAPGNPRIT